MGIVTCMWVAWLCYVYQGVWWGGDYHNFQHPILLLFFWAFTPIMALGWIAWFMMWDSQRNKQPSGQLESKPSL